MFMCIYIYIYLFLPWHSQVPSVKIHFFQAPKHPYQVSKRDSWTSHSLSRQQNSKISLPMMVRKFRCRSLPSTNTSCYTTCNSKVWRKKPACPGPNFVPIFATILSDGDFTSNTGCWWPAQMKRFFIDENKCTKPKIVTKCKQTMISNFGISSSIVPLFFGASKDYFLQKTISDDFSSPWASHLTKLSMSKVLFFNCSRTS